MAIKIRNSNIEFIGMNIFNSLGSNYDLNFALMALCTKNNSAKKNLISLLESKYHGKAILVYKGREAIGLGLGILNFPKGSFVAINAFTCLAVYKAITSLGYQAELLDLDTTLNLNFSPELLKKKIKQNPKIKTVIVQNTLGYPCSIERIAEICRENNIVLIEDLAHSVGTTYANGKEAGTIGDFVALSFSQDKIIDAVSGGALIVKNKQYQDYISRHSPLSSKQQLLDRFYPFFTFIIRKTYQMGVGKLIHLVLKKANLLSKPMEDSFYLKYDLPNWYSYLAKSCFNNLRKNLEHRREIATIYNSMLDKQITSSFINQNIHLSSNLRYPIFVDNRQSLIEYLKKERVYVSDIWYDSVDASLPNSKIASDRILNLPTHKNVSIEQAKRLSKKINQWLELTLDSSRPTLFTQRINFATDSLITTKNIYKKEEWESFLLARSGANFLQSWYWGEFYQVLGNKIQRTGFYNNNNLVGVMLSIVEKAKRARYLIVPGGPIIDWTAYYVVKSFVKEIKKIAKSYNCVFVRVRPQLESSEFSKNLFKQNGFINAPMYLHAELTSQLDITKTEETLLSQMRKTTRYEIKKAIAGRIEITRSQDPSKMVEFYDLQIETSKRQKFVPFSYKYLFEQFKLFANNNKALLFKAEVNNKLLAKAFIIYYGKEAVYHYGASTSLERNYPGNYLIQWEAIKEAKRRGMQRYNFWGVSPLDKPDHRFYGLSLFKRGFGGQDVEYLQAQDLVINYPRYLLNYAIETVRKTVRNV